MLLGTLRSIYALSCVPRVIVALQNNRTMPGPKMGPRPVDFDEDMIRNSPTFLKWLSLEMGQKMRYACREFVRGHGDDEERLMRRIMIARRNNIRDHEVLKKARRQIKICNGEVPDVRRSRRPPASFSDHQVEQEMDVQAVEATRSYRSWRALADGAEFVYNQKYFKGKEGHDWLLRKNIWRRMRYRRENKKMVDRLRVDPNAPDSGADVSSQASVNSGGGGSATGSGIAGSTTALGQHLLDHTGLLGSEHHHHSALHHTSNHIDNNNNVKTDDSATQEAAAAAAATSDHLADQAAVEAAVAAAETFGKSAAGGGYDLATATGTDPDTTVVHNPLDTAAAQAALDAAAQLAAATAVGHHEPLDTVEDDVLLLAKSEGPSDEDNVPHVTV